jgi:hypothetical protein
MPARPAKDWNGPSRELGGSIGDERVYCVRCGTIFVPAHGRDCPACTLAEVFEEVIDADIGDIW